MVSHSSFLSFLPTIFPPSAIFSSSENRNIIFLKGEVTAKSLIKNSVYLPFANVNVELGIKVVHLLASVIVFPVIVIILLVVDIP